MSDQDFWKKVWDGVVVDKLNLYRIKELTQLVTWMMETFEVELVLTDKMWKVVKKGLAYVHGNFEQWSMIHLKKRGLHNRYVLQYKSTIWGDYYADAGGESGKRLRTEINELFIGTHKGPTPIPFVKGFKKRKMGNETYIHNSSQLQYVRVRRMVKIDDGVLSDQIEDPNAKLWFHFVAQHEREGGFNFLTDGKVILPANSENVLSNKTPKRSVDLTRMNHIDKKLIQDAIKQFLEEAEG